MDALLKPRPKRGLKHSELTKMITDYQIAIRAMYHNDFTVQREMEKQHGITESQDLYQWHEGKISK